MDHVEIICYMHYAIRHLVVKSSDVFVENVTRQKFMTHPTPTIIIVLVDNILNLLPKINHTI